MPPPFQSLELRAQIAVEAYESFLDSFQPLFPLRNSDLTGDHVSY